MAQTHIGAMKVLASKAGVPLDELLSRHAAGQKWCYSCRRWLPHGAYSVDRSRWDGRSATCAACRNGSARAHYQPKGRPAHCGPLPLPARDGDGDQARHRINRLVTAGRLSDPRQIACADCGHVWREGERRHEYDHYLGYGAAHHLDVQAVCTRCHRRREVERQRRSA